MGATIYVYIKISRPRPGHYGVITTCPLKTNPNQSKGHKNIGNKRILPSEYNIISKIELKVTRVDPKNTKKCQIY